MAHVTFIHGMANKPPHDALLEFWRRSLAESDGLDLGTENVTSSMVYWANVMYPEALKEATESGPATSRRWSRCRRSRRTWASSEMDAAEKAWVATARPQDGRAAGRGGGGRGGAVAGARAARAHSAAVAGQGAADAPAPARRPPLSLQRGLHAAARRTYRVQDEIRARMLRALQEGAQKPGPHVVVSHSMGTVIAYDCLKRVPRRAGRGRVHDHRQPPRAGRDPGQAPPGWSRDDGFPHEKVRGGWVNVYDRLDPVAGFDPAFANDYRRERGERRRRPATSRTPGSWRHDIAKYLRGPRLREKLRGLLGLG